MKQSRSTRPPLHAALAICLALTFTLALALVGCGGGDGGDGGGGEGTGDATAARGGAAAQPATAGGATRTGAPDTSRFDPHDIDNALAWWISRVRDLGAAQGSGNQMRIDAARQELDTHLASLRGQRIRYTFNVNTPSVGGALATGQAISRDGVHIGIQHETDHGAMRVGSRTDASGRHHTESTPILIRTGQGIDEATLMQLTTSSSFLAAATVTDTTWLGATFMRPPTLVLFVDNVQVEQINP